MTYDQDREGQKANRLIDEKSPYLLQHAYNPVDWFPWGDKAFEKAKEEDKPVFLSIGYSTCHWCHVMERESFESRAVADFLNHHFVSIKVDREERPDIDAVYMAACQAMTGSGGWPLTVFLTPDKKPFFAGTYFPKENRHGRIGFMELTEKIRELWENQKQDIFSSADKLLSSLQDNQKKKTSAERFKESLLEKGFALSKSNFDKEYGGFGSSPKFPMPHQLFFLLRYGYRKNHNEALKMVEKTLDSMGDGGLYDHIGYGFHRYSTDEKWLLPHFEKMLYDQALIAIAYTEAYQAIGKKEYARKVEEIFTYVLRDMTGKEGGFYSAEDADSEGVEGKFYVWTADELKRVLGEDDYEAAAYIFNSKEKGNFVPEALGEKGHDNIFHIDKDRAEMAEKWQLSEDELERKIEKIREKLFEVRKDRIHPHKDDKVLTDWNGLMIAALALGGKVLGNNTYIEAAEKSARFVLKHLRDEEGRLLKSYREGEARGTGHANDYAYLVWGLLELYEATFVVEYLETALRLNDTFISLFWDDEDDGFYLTAADAEDLPIRPKEVYDGATPSANSVAACNLMRLSRLTGKSLLADKASAIFDAFAGEVNSHPIGYTKLLSAYDFYLGPPLEIVIAGEKESRETAEMLQALHSKFSPHKVVLLKDERKTEHKNDLESIAPFTKEHKEINGKTTAYVCRNFACRAPTTDPRELLMQIEDN